MSGKGPVVRAMTVLLVTAMMLTGCSDDDDLSERVDALAASVEVLNDQVDELESERDALRAELDDLRRRGRDEPGAEILTLQLASQTAYDLPPAFPERFPIPSGAELVESESSEVDGSEQGFAAFEITATVASLDAFYEAQLQADEGYEPLPGGDDPDGIVRNYNKDGRYDIVIEASEDDGGAVFSITSLDQRGG